MWFQLVYRCLLSLSEHCNVPSHATPLALSRRYFYYPVVPPTWGASSESGMV